MKRERLLEFIIIAAGLLLAGLLSLSLPGKMLNLKLYDILSIMKPKPPEWNKIVYVNIDDQAIDLVGRWPWPRYEEARGIEVLKEFGASKILFDIEFIEPSRDILNYEVYDQVAQDPSLGAQPFNRLLPELIVKPDNDLARAMAEGSTNVYLACRGVDESKKERTDIAGDEFQEIRRFADRVFIPLKDPKLTNSLKVDPFMETPVFPLYFYAKGMGFTTIPGRESDVDGALRKIHLFRIYDNYLVPQLAMPIVLDALDVKKDEIEIIPGKYIRLPLKNGEEIKIPISKEGEMYINWSKKWRDEPFAPHISFNALLEYYNNRKILDYYREVLANPGVSKADKDIIQQEYIPQLLEALGVLSQKLSVLKDKIVIVGQTSSSSTDVGAITIDPEAPLVLLQGNVINTIYQRKFLRQAPGIVDWIITIGFIAILFIAGIRFKSAAPETFTSIGLLLFLVVLDYVLISAFGIILNYGFTLSGTFVTFLGLTGFKYIQYDKQKNQIKNAFMHYLSPEVVKQVIDNPGLLKLGGERREITAYFSDVQGFTSISESLSPEEIVQLLNRYLTALTDIILKYEGTVDKYEGDAIVAFFGAPLPHPDHAIRCCNAAVEMQKTLEGLRKQWISEGYPEVLTRMGINTGPAIIGNMGSQQRMDYTMMGDTVNLASRLEGANKAYGTYTMISESTYKAVKDVFLTRRLDLLKVVGKKDPINVYHLINRTEEASSEEKKLVEVYNQGLVLYEKRDWNGALEIFRKLAEETGDAPAQNYTERCSRFAQSPPPDDWDGVYVLKTK